jgi:hypothetical protein
MKKMNVEEKKMKVVGVNSDEALLYCEKSDDYACLKFSELPEKFQTLKANDLVHLYRLEDGTQFYNVEVIGRMENLLRNFGKLVTQGSKKGIEKVQETVEEIDTQKMKESVVELKDKAVQKVNTEKLKETTDELLHMGNDLKEDVFGKIKNSNELDDNHEDKKEDEKTAD